MNFIERWSKKIQDSLGTTILQRRKRVLSVLRTDGFVSAASLVESGAGSRASVEATLAELETAGFVESQFRGGEPTMRRGSVRVYRRTKIGQHWLTSGNEL